MRDGPGCFQIAMGITCDETLFTAFNARMGINNIRENVKHEVEQWRHSPSMKGPLHREQNVARFDDRSLPLKL